MRNLALALGIVCTALAASAEPLQVSTDVPFGAAVADNIKDECALPRSQADAVLAQLAAAGVEAQGTAASEAPATGRFLQLRIESAMSAGNAFTGHRKQVTTSAVLYEDGQEVARTTKSRDSMGGFFGGYRSSCNVLRRCTNTLGKDIAGWVASQP